MTERDGPEDGDLLRRALAGDTASFDRMIERHRERLLCYVYALTGNAEDAQDVTQEALVRAYRYLHRLRETEKFGPWLRRVALNVVRDARRHQLAFPVLAMDERDMESLPDAASYNLPPRVEQVRWALSALPPDQREVVRLHYFEGCSYEEIGDQLRLPESTVRGRLHQARRRLKQEIGPVAAPRQRAEKRRGKDRTMFVLTPEDMKALRGAELIASDDPFYKGLRVVRIEPDGSILSNDSCRMFVYRGSSLRPERRMLVPSSLFSGAAFRAVNVRAQLAFNPGEAVLLLAENGTDAEWTERAPLEAGEVPAVEAILPADWKVKVRLSVGELNAALEEVARMEVYLNTWADPGAKPDDLKIALTMEDGQDALTLGVRALKEGVVPTRWSMNAVLSAKWTGLDAGETLTLTVSRPLLRDCMQALALSAEDEMEIGSNGPMNPILVRKAESENPFTVLMPVHPRYAWK